MDGKRVSIYQVVFQRKSLSSCSLVGWWLPFEKSSLTGLTLIPCLDSWQMMDML